MLLIVLVWWLIGLIILLVTRGKVMLAELRSKKFSISTTIIGMVILSFMAPALIILEIIKGIIDILTNDEES